MSPSGHEPRTPGDRSPQRAASDVARLLVVAGGRLGVGATTLAMNLARELAQDALRIVLIDADLGRADIAARCALPGNMTIADVLTGRKTIHEALQRGPAGMQVLAGGAAPQINPQLDDRSLARLLKQMRTLAPHADWLVVDAGNRASDLAARLWAAADVLAIVTAADAVAVMDTYALVKTLHSRQALRRSPSLVVNQTADEMLAADVHRRIDQSCRRFLGLSVTYSGALASNPALSGSEFVESGPLAASVSRLCKQLVSSYTAGYRSPLAA